MASEWQKYRLDDIAEVIDSLHKSPSYSDHGYSMVRVTDIRPGFLNLNNTFKVTFSIFDEFTKKYKPKKGDIVFSRVGSYGISSYVSTDEPFCLGQNTVVINPKIDERFLYLTLQSASVRHQIESVAVGTTQKTISLKSIKNLEILCPEVQEQKAIAHILGSLDDKIELNRQMNATLEAMAQALFKSWFVDFDPVIDNALAAGNPIPDELEAKAAARQALGDARKPLPEDIRSLFPNAFVFTEEMGWIPEGWEILSVSEAITVNPSVQLKKGEVAPFIDMKALPTSGYAIDDVSRKAYAGGAKFKNKDVLLARITPCLENGKTGVVDFLKKGESGFGSTEFIILRGRNGLNMPFVACLARDDKFRTHCIQSMVGSSGRQRVQNACFDSFYLCLPKSEKIKQQFHDSTNGFFEKITTLKNETNSLTQLRDTLLPKLLSGELRIPEADELVEESVA
ncbi:restriction endonuclease subunit S [Thiothrix unzii]|uniref:Restriction endonuclease subunit S n=1 Tax=Thiothrix unzii TaxID=111769 RepID=A0A975F8D8_9GAMM|nr:restriction endonuclease subunit S [Thiothrix unzii]QTR53087.1 restriction endonuclease subunit S [Thiothrix unzii]